VHHREHVPAPRTPPPAATARSARRGRTPSPAYPARRPRPGWRRGQWSTGPLPRRRRRPRPGAASPGSSRRPWRLDPGRTIGSDLGLVLL
jgi:hypothetical protein